jgi:hypothetical protein
MIMRAVGLTATLCVLEKVGLKNLAGGQKDSFNIFFWGLAEHYTPWIALSGTKIFRFRNHLEILYRRRI